MGRRVGDWQPGREDSCKVVAGGPGWARQQLTNGRSHICIQINWEGQLGSETDHETRVPVWGNKPLTEKTCGI